ncbi:MAG: hypothetical protein LVR00_05590 [Rhabdochlamydiaceae bacterium]
MNTKPFPIVDFRRFCAGQIVHFIVLQPLARPLLKKNLLIIGSGVYMLLFLIEQLSLLGYKVPVVFGNISTRLLFSALTALLFTIFLGPRYIKKLYEMKTGQSIRVEDCPMLAELHEKKKTLPQWVVF